MATPNGPFEEGWLAYTESNTNNPYFEGSEEYDEWWNGYYYAEDHHGFQSGTSILN